MTLDLFSAAETPRIYPDATPPSSTPWGAPQGPWKRYGPGIYGCSTAGHGGLWLSRERMADIPADLRASLWLGNGPWFEEDSDSLVPAYVWPDLFPAAWAEYAVTDAARRRAEIAKGQAA